MKAAIETVDAELERVRGQLRTLAQGEAEASIKIDKLTAEMRERISAGTDSADVEMAILSERAELQKKALRRTQAEKLLEEKSSALRAARRERRIEDLEKAETVARRDLAVTDAEIITLVLKLSSVLTRRMKAEHDISAINGRLQHLAGAVRPCGNLAFSGAALNAEFLRVNRREAERGVPFGSRAWGPFSIEIPCLTPDLNVPAIVRDSELAASE